VIYLADVIDERFLALINLFFIPAGIIILLLISATTASAQPAPNSASILADAYQSQLAAINANDTLIQKLAAGDSKLTTEYQAALQKQTRLNQQAKAIESLSQAYQDPLISSTQDVVKTEYQTLLDEYRKTALANILTPSAAGQQKEAQLVANLNKITDAYSPAAAQQFTPTQLADNQEAVLVSSTVRNSSPFKAKQGTNFVYTFLTKLLKHGNGFLRQIVFTDLANALKLPFQIGVTLWVMFIGMRIFSGGAFDWADLLKKFAAVALISTFVFTNNGQYFFDWIMNPLIKTSYGLGTWFLQESTYGLDFDITASADNRMFAGSVIVEGMWWKAVNIGGYIYDSYSGLSLGKIVKAAFMFLIFVGGFTMILAKFAQNYAYSLFSMIIYFIMSPIMLCFFPFNATRPTAILWCRGLLNSLTLPVLTSLVMGFTLNLMLREWTEFEATMAKGAGGDISAVFPMVQFVNITGMVWVSYLIQARIDDVCAFLTGGVSPSLTNIVLQLANTLANAVTASATTSSAVMQYGGKRAATGLDSGMEKFNQWREKKGE